MSIFEDYFFPKQNRPTVNFGCLNRNNSNQFENDSAATSYMENVPASFAPPQPQYEKNVQGNVCKGPEVFGKVLGPTADESILVGLQALMDMAGTLEFTASSQSTSEYDQNPSVCTKMQSRSECRPCFCPVCTESNNRTNVHFDEINQQKLIDEVRRKQPPCQYIITQENIAASVHPRKQNRCQFSQTRVLPTSMTSYNPENTQFIANEFKIDKAPYPATQQKVKLIMKNEKSFPLLHEQCKLKSTTPGVVKSKENSASCQPCSKFFQQMTTISVLEDASNVERTDCCIPCKPIRPTLSEFTCGDPKCSKLDMNTSDEDEKDTEPCKESTCIYVQTAPLKCPKLCDVEIKTDSLTKLHEQKQQQQHTLSVACDCNFCMPISAGVSDPSSTTISNNRRCRNRSKSTFPSNVQQNVEYVCCSTCSNHKKGQNTSVKSPQQFRAEQFSSNRNKSCVCSLIPKGVRVADAACSCLKVNTSCQYYKTEYSDIESRSTQCANSSHNEVQISTAQVCNSSYPNQDDISFQSGDFKAQHKRSVQIISGPYECPDISEARYCMETDNNSVKSLPCEDELSDIFEKPTKISLEMGDSCIPPPTEVRYAITKITKFRDFSTFEVMKSTSKKPKCLPKSVEGVFVLKKEDPLLN